MSGGKIAIIGAGAAGVFAAARLRRTSPDLEIVLLEAGPRPLAKVAVTGGGRCNLSNTFHGLRSLAEAYPRGARWMERAFRRFGPEETRTWFEEAGVRLLVQEDECIFPASQDAMQIVRTLLREAQGSSWRTGCRVTRLEPVDGGWQVEGEHFDAVLVTTGGLSRPDGLLGGLDLEIVPPVPSLFTFRIDDPVTAMSGTVVRAGVALAGTKFRAEGPLLITDWGMSGPAILKLSSYAARHLAERQYKAELLVRWLPETDEIIRARVREMASVSPQRQVSSTHPKEIPSRLWACLAGRSGIPEGRRWAEVGALGLNRLAATLAADPYPIAGKSRFREEFVTCGGVSLAEIDPATQQARKHPGLFFAGEVLDIDAITGGFNLQAAWTTGWIAAEGIRKTLVP